MSQDNIQIVNEEPLLRRRSTVTQFKFHKIEIGIPNKNLNDNKIQTNKYTILTFLPLNLFEQFSKIANIYFLMIAILQTILIISITHGQPTILVPLIFVVVLTGCKDLFEDYSRYKSDKIENENVCTVLTENQENQQKNWKVLRPGEIIKVHRNQFFPADCLLLQTSNNLQNIAFVETKNLDGETSLQQKKISNYKYNQAEYNSQQQKDIIFVEENIGQLNQFQGAIKQNNQQILVDQDNLFLRGSSLRNTEWVICLVIYTGKNTKIMLNSIRTRLKSGTIDKKTSIIVILTFLFQLALSMIAALIYSFDMYNYKYQKEENQYSFLEMFIMKMGNWTLILGNFIPISLLVTLEMVKFFQALIINKDTDLQYTLKQEGQEPVTIPCKVQNSSVNEDLGQINYVFTDKTGTLTENVMKFQGLIIDDQEFCLNQDQSKKVQEKFNEKIELAYKCMALCHSIIFDEHNKPSSSSSEEIAIWEFLQQKQREYKENIIEQDQNQTNNYYLINNEESQERWRVIQAFEFSSDKKRMSILVKKGEQIYLFTKGADDTIWENLKENEKSVKLQQNITQQAEQGFRVMALSYKKLQKQNLNIIQQQILEAQQSSNKKELLDQIQNQIETEMSLIGAVVLQDKLQENVAESINFMKEANIKIWMITGDKTQTALSIGRSSKIIEKNIQIYVLEENYQEFFDMLNNHVYINEKFSVIVKGSFFFKMSLKYGSKFEKFTQFLKGAESVIFSRATPKLKAIIVNMIRSQKEQFVTLAIGDGANDVNMINAAHVGIGLKGLEGKQAARASDYQVSRFKHLLPLIFYYGRENYRKNTTLVLYILYKNILIVMINYWFGFLNTFSGESLYESYTFQLFNTTVTFLPSFVFAIFDYTLSKEQFLNDPRKYKVCQDRIYFSIKRFLSFFANGMIGSLFILFTGLIIFDTTSISQGHFYGFWNMGNMCFYGGVLITNLKLLSISNSLSVFGVICYIVSILNFFLFWKALNLVQINDLYNTYWEVMKSPELFIFTVSILALVQIERISENYISKYIMRKYNQQIQLNVF